MVSGENPIRRRKYSSGQRFYRLLRLRLIIPMFRARQPAENTARAVAVGLFWAFTPTFGIQMGLTFIHWYCSRTFLKKDFNVVVAMAWTWVTNVFTVPICYYLFFLTGQILLGRWSDLTGYESFNKFWATAMGAAGSDPTSLQAWNSYFSIIIEGWGLALIVGSIPFALIGYVGGYYWTLSFVRRWRNKRAERRRMRALGARQGSKPSF